MASIPTTAQAGPGDARETVKEWVQVQKTLSRERAEWRQKKALMQDRIQVLDTELQALRETIAEAENKMSAVDEERSGLLEEEATLQERADGMRAFVADLEKRLQALRPRWPEPLDHKVASLYRKLPEQAGETERGLAERMRTVVAILSSVQQFNSAITVSREIRERSDGRQAEVVVIYAGLGQAWYAGAGEAGYGYPSVDGWQWHAQPDIAEEVEAALAIAEARAAEARFVDLPIRLDTAGKGGDHE